MIAHAVMLAAALTSCCTLLAQTPPPAPALRVYPPSIRLDDANDRQRVFVFEETPSGATVDVTQSVQWRMLELDLVVVYREGDLISPPARGLQTTLVPAGGATVVEFNTPVPGNLTLVDHSIWRIEKGAAGFIVHISSHFLKVSLQLK